MQRLIIITFCFAFLFLSIESCKRKDDDVVAKTTTVNTVTDDTNTGDDNDTTQSPIDTNSNGDTSKWANYQLSDYTPIIPTNWPSLEEELTANMSLEGIQLGRYLYYDPILSRDSGFSCNSCHTQDLAFSAPANTMANINGVATSRNVMSLANVAWTKELAWDSRDIGLLNKIHGTRDNPFGMDSHNDTILQRLKADTFYNNQFARIYGEVGVTHDNIDDALAQFLITLVSSNSTYDKYLRGEYIPTDQEFRGYEIFFTEKGDCFHCHGGKLMTDNELHNTGLDSVFTDLGAGTITGNSNDNGKFRTTTLRNIELTGPYMHDGRFTTLDEVIDFYSEGLLPSATVDPLMKNVHKGGIQLDENEKADLKAFLLLFTDTSFINNKQFSNPF